jgi:hypothetical protein
MDRRAVAEPEVVARERRAPIVGADRAIQVSAGFLQHDREPQGRESRRYPWVEIGGIVGPEVDDARRTQHAEPGPREVGGAGQPEVARAVGIHGDGAVLEPRLGHDDGLDRVGDERRRQTLAASDVVVAGPVRGHVAKRHHADRLRYPVPIVGRHAIPGRRADQERPIPTEHRIQTLFPQVVGHAIPVGDVHHPPEAGIPEERGRGRRPWQLPAGHRYRDRQRRAVEEGVSY